MHAESPRWNEVSASEFAHERQGLELLREYLPDRAPFRAWTNFEFRDLQGKWHEIDALVLGEKRFHLVELKHYQGAIGGNAYAWQRGRRTEESPLRRTRHNAQRLSSLIKSAVRDLSPGLESEVPWVQECVFLHAENFRMLLPPGDQNDLFGPDGREQSTNLLGLSRRLLEPLTGRRPKLLDDDALIAALFERIGFGVRRERSVGSWRLLGPSADGEGWQDWDAEHNILHNEHTRIRFFVSPPGASDNDRRRQQALVKREYEFTRRLQHESLAQPRDIVDDELGIGLVYRVEADEQRLDLWLADHDTDLSLDDRLALIRQLAEALKYVHRRHVVHRALSPTAVTVRGTGDSTFLRVGDWQFAGEDRPGDPAASRGTATRLFAEDDQQRSTSDDAAYAYLAPEGRWSGQVDRVKLDVFALGAISYLILTGKPPASDGADARLRLQRDQAFDPIVDLSQVPTQLRRAIRDATQVVVSSRFATADAFLAALDERLVEPTTDHGDVDDPLDARVGDVIAGRYVLERRLGAGSTAVGLLVTEPDAENEPFVLKVALDDRAAGRLRDEAEVLTALRQIRSNRLVRMIGDSTIELGTRTALRLESAGTDTLADVLRGRGRLSIDLLDRWGTDLLDALVALDRAGIDHRDIKPANLGVREQRADRAKHLVLFDFSLSRAGASALDAGTPPYLDPFLGAPASLPARPIFDSAAERYAAAVTLYEMATGELRGPTFGDGDTDPGMIQDEATIEPAAFDRSIAAPLTTFFTRALRRDARRRFDTAAEMLTAWRDVFALPATTTVPDVDVPTEVTATTPLVDSGLTARALSALEQLRLETVGDLAAQDPARITRLAGVAALTRKEIVGRAKQWRAQFGTRAGAPAAQQSTLASFRDPKAAAERLVDIAADRRSGARRDTAKVLLGLAGDIDAFDTLSNLAVALGKNGAPQVSVALAAVQKAWSDADEACSLLDDVAQRTVAAVRSFGGAATVELVVELLAGTASDVELQRIVRGLVRAALDRADDVAQGSDEPPPIVRRRFRARPGLVLLATSSELLDLAGTLAAVADGLLVNALQVGEELVPLDRAVTAMSSRWPTDLERPSDRSLVLLAASTSERASVSARGELHDRSLSPAAALKLAAGNVPPNAGAGPDDLASWVRARFPSLPALPSRPQLDRVVSEAGLALRWNGSRYLAPDDASYTTGMGDSNSVTHTPAVRDAVERRVTALDSVLTESRNAHSFLTLGVPRRWRVERAEAELQLRYQAQAIDLTGLVIDALAEQSARFHISWDDLTAADAADEGSKAWTGLRQLVRNASPGIEARLTEFIETSSDVSPALLTEPGPFARYDLMSILARLADITARHARAVWLLIPLDAEQSATIDRKPVQLSHGGQFLVLDDQWLDAPILEGEPS